MSEPGQRAAAEAAVLRARKILLARQDADGCWPGLSAEDAGLDAECMLARELLGVGSPEQTSAIAQHLRSLQHADGSWSGGEISASVLAYLALRLAGDSADAYHLAIAAGWIRDAGGLAAASVETQAWLAMFGLTGWQDVRVPAPEAFFRPARQGEWAGLSRSVALSLAVLGSLRPVRDLPFNLAELRTGLEFARQDRRFRLRMPPVGLAKSAETAVLRKCGQKIIDWQQRVGLPSSPRPAWAGSLVALSLLGYPVSHPALAGALGWLDAVTARPRQGVGQRYPARRPPVRDTALAIEALADAGVPADDAALVAAARWLLGERITGPVEGPGAAQAGWSFSADGYPAVADTANVMIALSRVGLAGRAAIGNPAHWLTGMQGRDGSWGSSAMVTARVVQALATHGQPDARAIRRGVVWLLLAQQPDGSWSGQPGASELVVTAAVLTALLVAGVRPGKPVIVSGTGWLLERQNPDAGWAGAGSGARRRARAKSDAQGTACAVTALLATGGHVVSDLVDLGADWLVRAQQADGGWGDRPAGRSGPRRRPLLVPGLVVPLGALGRYVAVRAAADLAEAESSAVIRLGARLSGAAEPVPAAGD